MVFWKRTSATARPMRAADRQQVLAIIRAHDAEDYEEARRSLRRGIDHLRVLEEKDRIVAVSGAKAIGGTDRTHMLSWTYVAPEHHGKGIGGRLVASVLQELEDAGARRVFVTTTLDPQPGRRPAAGFYERLGFEEELRHASYYTASEGIVFLGLRLGNTGPATDLGDIDDDGVVFTKAREIVETDGAYSIDWAWRDEKRGDASPRLLVEQVREDGGRVAFVGGPSCAEALEEHVLDAGFHQAGQLRDYYADGIHENHYRCDLSASGYRAATELGA